MSVKIINKGKNPKEIPLRGTCYNCRTEVECAKSDAETSYSQHDGRSWMVACPVCEGSIYLNEYVPHDGRGPG